MVWETVQNVGILAAGTGAAGLLVRFGMDRFAAIVEGSIDQFFDEKRARREAELKNDHVVFQRLHEARANVIVELYTRVVTFERDVRAVTTGGPSERPREELLQQATASGNALARYYMENRIYFPPETCDAVERLQDAMQTVFADFSAGTPHDGRPEQPADVENWLANWRNVTDEEVPELKRELETHFRALLGVDLDGEDLTDSDG